MIMSDAPAGASDKRYFKIGDTLIKASAIISITLVYLDVLKGDETVPGEAVKVTLSNGENIILNADVHKLLLDKIELHENVITIA